MFVCSNIVTIQNPYLIVNFILWALDTSYTFAHIICYVSYLNVYMTVLVT